MNKKIKIEMWAILFEGSFSIERVYDTYLEAKKHNYYHKIGKTKIVPIEIEFIL